MELRALLARVRIAHDAGAGFHLTSEEMELLLDGATSVPRLQDDLATARSVIVQQDIERIEASRAQAGGEGLRPWVQAVYDTFKKAEDQGYRSKERQYAIDMLGKALELNPTPVDEPKWRDTIQTLLDLLNPLHGSLDRQLYDERIHEELEIPKDREYAVDVTEQQERDLTQAVLILENRRRALDGHPLYAPTPADEPKGEGRDSNADIAWAAEQCAVIAESGVRVDDGDPFNVGWSNCCRDIATVIRDFAREYDKPTPADEPKGDVRGALEKALPLLRWASKAKQGLIKASGIEPGIGAVELAIADAEAALSTPSQDEGQAQ